jgi:hypothetical protein
MVSDGSTTIVLVEAAIELAIAERAQVRLTLRALTPGGEREKISGAPQRIEEVSASHRVVVLATANGLARVPLERVIGARRI